MIKILDYSKVSESEILNRNNVAVADVEAAVTEILDAVRERGDAALFSYCEQFDGVALSSLEVSPAEFDAALEAAGEEFVRILKRSAANIEAFHSHQKRNNFLIDGEDGVKLNTNESPFPPAAHAELSLQLYPDPECRTLREAFSEELGVSPSNLIFTNGSDEALAFIFLSLCERGAAFPDLTYGFYSVYADLFRVPKKIIPLREDFTLALSDYAGLSETLFIANPNAPTGLAHTRAELEALIAENPDRLVVVDEAYVDFGGESAVPLIEQYDNLLVVGTFSKSRSLAGARLGYAVGNCELIGDLYRVKFSFNP